MRNWSLQTKRIAVIFGIVVLLGGPATLIVGSRLTERLNRELELRSAFVAQTAAEHVTENALTRNLVQLQSCLHRLQQLDKNIAYILTTDEQGAVIAHTFDGAAPAELGRLPFPRMNQPYLISRLTLPDETAILDVAVPIRTDQDGYVHMGFKEESLRASIASVVRMVIWIIVLFLLIATIVSIFFSRILMMRPLKELNEAAQRISAGELKEPVPVRSGDELGQLATAFNAMAAGLDSTMVSRNQLLQEIAHRRETEKALQSSEEIYRSVVNNIGIGVSMISPEMRILTLNRRMREWFPHLNPDENPLCYQAFNNPPRQEHCSYCPTILTFQDGLIHEAVTDTPAGDRIRHYRIVSSPIKDNGRVASVVEMVEDITEKMTADRRLREAQQRLEQIVATTPSITYVAGPVNPYPALFISTNVREVTGFAAQDFIADPSFWFNHLHPEDRKTMIAGVENLFTKGEYAYEYRFLHRDGRYLWMHDKMRLIRDPDGGAKEIVGSWLDITERREMEEQLRRSHDELEQRIRERMEDLQRAYAGLQEEIAGHEQSKNKLEQTNAKLLQLVKKLEVQSRNMALLTELGNLIQTCKTGEEARMVTARILPRLFPGVVGCLYLNNASQTLLEAVAVWGDREVRPPVFTTEKCWALRRGHVHYIAAANGLICPHVEANSPVPAAYICTPMIAQNENIGLIHLQFTPPGAVAAAGGGPDWSVDREDLLAFVATTAEHLAIALANVRLREILHDQSVRDVLTGLFNRRYLEETLEREILRAERAGTPLSVIMLDIDHFKKFNDSFGHEAGDIMLRSLANFLQLHVRGDDVACRYGGEEFTLILPSATLEIAVKRAELLRERVAAVQISYAGQHLGPITLSFGVAVFPDHGRSNQDVLVASDSALYRAKRAGRNRVETAVMNKENNLGPLFPATE